MLRGVQTRLVVFASALVAVGGAALIAQSALASIGVVDAEAREWGQKVVEDGGPGFNETYDPRVLKALDSFKKLPAGARGATTRWA